MIMNFAGFAFISEGVVGFGVEKLNENLLTGDLV